MSAPLAALVFIRSHTLHCFYMYIVTITFVLSSLHSYGSVGDVALSEVQCPTSDYLHLLRCSHQLGQHMCIGNRYVSLNCSKY